MRNVFVVIAKLLGVWYLILGLGHISSIMMYWMREGKNYSLSSNTTLILYQAYLLMALAGIACRWY